MSRPCLLGSSTWPLDDPAQSPGKVSSSAAGAKLSEQMVVLTYRKVEGGLNKATTTTLLRQMTSRASTHS